MTTLTTALDGVLRTWGCIRFCHGNKQPPNISGWRQVYLSHTKFTLQNFPRQLSSTCWLSIPGYLKIMALPYTHFHTHTSVISQAEWEPNDLILTIKFSIPQATQACSVHNPLERTNHKTPPTPQLQVRLGSLILSYNEKGRKLNKDKYLQSTFNMNCSKFAKQLYAVRMNVLILNTRGTID